VSPIEPRVPGAFVGFRRMFIRGSCWTDKNGFPTGDRFFYRKEMSREEETGLVSNTLRYALPKESH
jgi:hypothetical protein